MCITARAAVSNFKHAGTFSAVQTSRQKKCYVQLNHWQTELQRCMVQVRYSLIAPLYQDGARILEVLYPQRDTCSTSPVSAQRRFAARGALVQWTHRTCSLPNQDNCVEYADKVKLNYPGPRIDRSCDAWKKATYVHGREFEGRDGVAWFLHWLQARKVLQQRRSWRSGFAFCKSLVNSGNKIGFAWRVAKNRRYVYYRTMESLTAEL